MVVSGQLHVPAALYPGKEPPVSIGLEAGWAHSRFGRGDKRSDHNPYRELNPGRPARNLVTVLSSLLYNLMFIVL